MITDHVITQIEKDPKLHMVAKNKHVWSLIPWIKVDVTKITKLFNQK